MHLRPPLSLSSTATTPAAVTAPQLHLLRNKAQRISGDTRPTIRPTSHDLQSKLQTPRSCGAHLRRSSVVQYSRQYPVLNPACHYSQQVRGYWTWGGFEREGSFGGSFEGLQRLHRRRGSGGGPNSTASVAFVPTIVKTSSTASKDPTIITQKTPFFSSAVSLTSPNTTSPDTAATEEIRFSTSERVPEATMTEMLSSTGTAAIPQVKTEPPKREFPRSPLFRTKEHPELPELKGLVFDLDGTLTLPQPWMFPAMRAASGAPPGTDILAHISTLEPAAARKALAEIKAIEAQAMAQIQPQPGLRDLMSWATRRGLRTAILTRNLSEPVTHLVAEHLAGHEFEPVLTREMIVVNGERLRPKPAPDGLVECCRQWGVKREEVLMVGDMNDDVDAAREAGVGCVVVRNGGNGSVWEREGVVGTVGELGELVRLCQGEDEEGTF